MTFFDFRQLLSQAFNPLYDAIKVDVVHGSSGGSGGGAQTTFTNGAKSSIATGVAEQLVATSNPASIGILIRADANNTGVVYIGSSDTTTAGTDDDTDGMPIYAREPFTIEVNNANKVWLIASDTGQKVYWSAV